MKDALWNSKRHAAPLNTAQRPVPDHQDTGLVVEQPANGIDTQISQFGDLLGREVPLNTLRSRGFVELPVACWLRLHGSFHLSRGNREVKSVRWSDVKPRRRHRPQGYRDGQERPILVSLKRRRKAGFVITDHHSRAKRFTWPRLCQQPSGRLSMYLLKDGRRGLKN